MADELKALGNKAIAEKNFDEAMYVRVVVFTLSARHPPNAFADATSNSS
jgi:hypothetical protein